ncbi:type II toxin-antitoxin system VapC family toxin [Antarcticirhabdus aurantiaca]|uniref:Type II toxin-antitoxin system VapC family toxin n=1 Tax=Antarcticirhabdus aurantiaca TaxID=2606717 RepID=A0ACD4NLQ7_9HYPH|nr:type II toxin-antitoxin system VapC family toxin [Antarcticirhabdus aurantiaca]WAJ27759.1 type II toxin-antitoxin system VapC family toxin [Jeongeuplla avenae]
MIVLDTSAVVAILGDEPDAAELTDRATLALATVMSAGTALELSIVVLSKWGPDGLVHLDALLRELRTTVRPVDEAQVRAGTEAYRCYGRGSGHPARLNFGDCFAYALARSLGAPLFFKGDDFVHTDIAPAHPA